MYGALSTSNAAPSQLRSNPHQDCPYAADPQSARLRAAGAQFTCFTQYKKALSLLALLGAAGTQFTCVTQYKKVLSLLAEQVRIALALISTRPTECAPARSRCLSLLALLGTQVQILAQQLAVLTLRRVEGERSKTA